MRFQLARIVAGRSHTYVFLQSLTRIVTVCNNRVDEFYLCFMREPTNPVYGSPIAPYGKTQNYLVLLAILQAILFNINPCTVI